MVVHKNTKQNNYLEKAYCCWKHLKIVGRSCLLTSKAHPLLSTNYYSGYNSATCEFISINFLSADKVGMYQLKIQISWWTTLKTRPVGEGLPSWDFDQGGQQAITSTSLPSPHHPHRHTHTPELFLLQETTEWLSLWYWKLEMGQSGELPLVMGRFCLLKWLLF